MLAYSAVLHAHAGSGARYTEEVARLQALLASPGSSEEQVATTQAELAAAKDVEAAWRASKGRGGAVHI